MRDYTIRTICLLILFIVGNRLNAQENFLPGYVVRNDGDTIQGEIHFNDWEKSPTFIRFKPDPQSNETKYKPLEISKFSVSGDFYRSAIVQVETSPWDLQDMNKYATFSFLTDTVFIRVIVSGKKSLFTYKPHIGKEQFYLGKDNGYELLLFKEYIKVIDGYHNKVENNKYIGQLIYYLQDCPGIQQIVSNVKYFEKSLINVFSDYNSCVGEDLDIHKEKEKATLKWGLFAGVSFTSVFLKGEDHPMLASMDFSRSDNFTFGGSLDIVFRGNQNKWSLYNELMWSSYSINSSYTDVKGPNAYDVYDVDIAMGYLKLNNMLRFRYPFKHVSIFGNLGISNGLALQHSNTSIRTYYFYSSVDSIPIETLSDLRIYEVGLLFGGGFGFKNFNLEFRYEIGSGFSAVSSLTSRANRMFFIVGYSF